MRKIRGRWIVTGAAIAAIAASGLASCDVSPAPTPDPSTPAPTTATAPAAFTPSPTPTTDAVEVAYESAMCPIFERIIVLDPMLAAARAGDADADELAALAAEVDAVADALATVPRWKPGQALADELRASLAAIRIALGDPERLAELPYITSATIDDAMLEARSAGFFCVGL